MSERPIITFTSDFGSREYYAGAVKGVILGIAPNVRIIDISHDVASHDLLEAAFTVVSAYGSFPPRTVHLVVADPGVGSERRAIIASTEEHLFVAPDNGVLSMVYAREQISRVVSIEAEHYFRRPVAPTFHARDIFGPVAAWLARGIGMDQFGPEVENYVRLALPPLRRLDDRRIEGIVLHIDKFGNVITSISPDEVLRILGREPQTIHFLVGEERVKAHYRYYAQASSEEIFSLQGSSGYYEIAALKKPAARLLNARRGTRVEIILEPSI
jgi:S-adenosyl-L-methionine hydrolase (adenosine-forming)